MTNLENKIYSQTLDNIYLIKNAIEKGVLNHKKLENLKTKFRNRDRKNEFLQQKNNILSKLEKIKFGYL